MTNSNNVLNVIWTSNLPLASIGLFKPTLKIINYDGFGKNLFKIVEIKTAIKSSMTWVLVEVFFKDLGSV